MQCTGWKRVLLATGLVLLQSCSLPPAPATNEVTAYQKLRAAYAVRDATSAAQAYSQDAVVTYRYQSPSEQYVGREQIGNSFKAFFDSIPPEAALDLNFRVESSERKNKLIYETGIYRLRIGPKYVSYGTFSIVRDPRQGVFLSDEAASASEVQFNNIDSELLFAE